MIMFTNRIDQVMAPLFALARRIAAPALRLTLGLIVLWIGALKFHDPSAIVALLKASLPVFAFNGFVYVLGSFEIIAAVFLLIGVGVRYAGLLCLILFGGTLTIFVVAPAVTYGGHGFPYLSLVGQFLLKDLVLAATSITLVAMDSARHAAGAADTLRPVHAA